MQLPPAIYIGPSLPHSDAEKWLPGAQLMPPIRRGDLYRDRLLGFELFVIVDGVFFNELAISPREIIDVIRDGATVLGAGSMGAIRAAECWPAGMHGVGTIYRLFRRGALKSDDEVAVTFAEDPPHRIVSVPLVNARYALGRAVRAKCIGPRKAARAIAAAEALHYPERTWETILQAARISNVDGTLATMLERYDLKKIDATRALKVAAKLQRRQRRRRRTHDVSRLGAAMLKQRERPHDAFDGQDRQSMKTEIVTWMLATGFYRTVGEKRDAPRLEIGWSKVRRFVSSSLWNELEASGDLDAVVYKFRAVQRAAAAASERGWRTRRAHREAARNAVASAHGYATWQDLSASFATQPILWERIETRTEELASAKLVRAALFSSPLQSLLCSIPPDVCRTVLR